MQKIRAQYELTAVMDAAQHIVQLVMRHLRPSQLFWHATRPSSYRLILKSGAIMPHVQESRWERTACRCLGAVSVFDFSDPTDEQISGTQDRWEGWLADTDESKIIVLIGISREGSEGKLILYPETKTRTDGMGHVQGPFPYIEVCYTGRIAHENFSKIFLFCPRIGVSREVSPIDLNSFEEQFESLSKEVRSLG